MSDEFDAFIAHQDDRVVVKVRGEVDLAVMDAFEVVVREAIAASPHVVFDMADVTFLDSSGIRVLVFAVLKVAGTGSVTIRNPQPNVARVLEVAGLTDVLTVEQWTIGGGSPGEV